MYEFDMYSITDSDLDEIKYEFEFICNRNGLFCGFVAWFDVIFKCDELSVNENVILSSSPYCLKTHWGQSVFPISEPMEILKGDKVKGEIYFFRNNVLRRNYRMFIDCKVNQNIFRKMFFVWQ